MTVQLFGLLGWPVEHSASPAMMNAAFKAMQQSAVYVAFPVEPANLETAIKGLVVLGARGLNVTIPHKQSVLSWVDVLTDEARLTGAVNTLKIDAATGRIHGHNTDVSGWWESVRGYLNGEEKTVAVIGAGGAARAVVAALALNAPSLRVHVIARRGQQAEALRDHFHSAMNLQIEAWQHRHDVIADADIVIQTTPLGMWPNRDASPVEDARCFRARQIVQDIVYRPLVTKFLSQAESQGATTVDGLKMLVAQGAHSYQYWLHTEPPTTLMYDTVQSVLHEGRT
jgi:shikimate dehydrogenase